MNQETRTIMGLIENDSDLREEAKSIAGDALVLTNYFPNPAIAVASAYLKEFALDNLELEEPRGVDWLSIARVFVRGRIEDSHKERAPRANLRLINGGL